MGISTWRRAQDAAVGYRGNQMKQYSLAQKVRLALALAAFAGAAAAGPDSGAVCSGSSSACLEQMSAVLSARDAGSDAKPAPRPRRAAAPERTPAPRQPPRLNLDRTLTPHPDSEGAGA
jgi:hypothetical protein